MKEYEDIICILKALSDETRLRILMLLARQEQSACQLHHHFPITQPTLSYHLKILTDCGLVTGTKCGCSTCYCVNRQTLSDLQTFIGSIGQ